MSASGVEAKPATAAAAPSGIGAPAATKVIKKKAVRMRGPADLMTRVIAKIKAGRPKDTKESRDCTYEVSRSSQNILSRVKYVLSTGITDYDDATGIGGLPFGRIVEVYGLDGAAKSAMALRCAVRMQMRQIYERVKKGNTDEVELRRVKADVPIFTIYIDNEQSLDDDGKVTIDGVELDIAVARCDTVDQMFKIIDTTIDGVAEFQRETQQECFILAVVDTVAGTASREEIKSKWEDVDYTRQPKQLREGFRVMTNKISRHNVLGVFTNQVSEKYQKTGGKKGRSTVPQDDDFSTFGGRALKYFASLRIFHSQSNPRYKLNRDLKFPSGRTIEFTVTKNRLGKPWRSGRMVLLYEGGLNDVFSQLETYIHLKLAERGETPGVKFRFGAAGVETTTFPKADAKGDAVRGNPGIESNDEWPAFLQEHKADFDKLRQVARTILFKEEALPAIEEGEMDVTASDVDVEEET